MLPSVSDLAECLSPLASVIQLRKLISGSPTCPRTPRKPENDLLLRRSSLQAPLLSFALALPSCWVDLPTCYPPDPTLSRSWRYWSLPLLLHTLRPILLRCYTTPQLLPSACPASLPSPRHPTCLSRDRSDRSCWLPLNRAR